MRKAPALIILIESNLAKEPIVVDTMMSSYQSSTCVVAGRGVAKHSDHVLIETSTDE